MCFRRPPLVLVRMKSKGESPLRSRLVMVMVQCSRNEQWSKLDKLILLTIGWMEGEKERDLGSWPKQPFNENGKTP